MHKKTTHKKNILLTEAHIMAGILTPLINKEDTSIKHKTINQMRILLNLRGSIPIHYTEK